MWKGVRVFFEALRRGQEICHWRICRMERKTSSVTWPGAIVIPHDTNFKFLHDAISKHCCDLPFLIARIVAQPQVLQGTPVQAVFSCYICRCVKAQSNKFQDPSSCQCQCQCQCHHAICERMRVSSSNAPYRTYAVIKRADRPSHRVSRGKKLEENCVGMQTSIEAHS